MNQSRSNRSEFVALYKDTRLWQSRQRFDIVVEDILNFSLRALSFALMAMRTTDKRREKPSYLLFMTNDETGDMSSGYKP